MQRYDRRGTIVLKLAKKVLPYFAVPLFMGALLFASYGVRPTILDFRFNPYAVASLISLVSNCALLVYMSRLKTKTAASYWFNIFLFTLTVWSFGESLQRLSLTREGALFWSTLASVGWVILPVSIFIFCLTYLRKDDWLKNSHLFYFLLVSTLGILYLNLSTDAFIPFTQSQLDIQSWGFNSGVEKYFPIFIVWFESLYLLSIVLMVQRYRSAKRATDKYQALYFSIALSIPFFVGSATDAILPIFNINFYPLAVTLTSVMALVFSYAIRRFGLLIYNPATVSGTILETMEEAVLVVNPSFSVEYANLRAHELLLLPGEELAGMSLERFFGTDFDHLKKGLLKPLTSQRFAYIERSLVLTQGGREVPVSISATRVTDERGEIEGYILVASDITKLEGSLISLNEKVHQIEEKNHLLADLSNQLQHEKEGVEHKVEDRTREVQEKQAQLLASINGLGMGFVMVDANFSIVLLNHAMEHLLKKLHHRPSKSLATLSHALGGVNLAQMVKDCMAPGPSQAMQEVLVDTTYLQIYPTPIVLADEVIGVVILVQDATESKALERAREEFFSIASHEMRTPLTAMNGYAALLQAVYGDKIKDPGFNKLTAGIVEGGTRLLRVVNDFLNMSRLEQGRLEFLHEPLDAVALLKDVVHEIKVLATKKKLKLIVHLPHHRLPKVEGDADRIREVLINLIGNAIKFTDGGSIIVSVEEEEKQLKISVHDTGKGIDPKNQSLLFRKFQQAGSSITARDASHGTGLGLYISRLMAEGMGGTLYLEESVKGEGSTFVFTLPIGR